MTEQLSFQQSIEASSQLIQKIDEKSISSDQAHTSLLDLLDSVQSARGLFVSLLTGKWNFGDSVPEIIVNACRQSGDIAEEVLTKNLVMSMCMKVHHMRCDDKTSAAGSEQVARRSIYLISQLRTAGLKSRLEAMNKAVNDKIENRDAGSDNEYVSFLTRWKYDTEQLSKVQVEITALLESVFRSEPSRNNL